MTEKLSQVYLALDRTDLETPTAAAKYAVGTVIHTADARNGGAEKTYIYVKAHAGLTAYKPYVLAIGAVAGAEKVTKAPATLAAPGSIVAVPQVAFTSGYYGFVQIKGDATVLMKAETYAVGDHLQILNAGVTLVVDGTSSSTVESINTCAISKATGTTAVAQPVYLKGEMAVIAAT